MKIASFAINRPITTMMIIISVIVIGAISIKRIPLLYLPELSGSSLWIDIPYKSSSPEEVEKLITLPVEEAMAAIEHLDSISSTSAANSASISLEFKIGTDMNLAAMQVRDRLDEIKDSLPEDIDRIKIHRFKTGDLPVLEFQIAGNMDIERLYDITEDVLKRRLQTIEGVAAVETRGIEGKQLFIELNQERLKSHHIDPYSLRNLIIANNTDLSAGTIIDGGREHAVRLVGAFQNVRDIMNLPVPISNSEIQDSGPTSSLSQTQSTNPQSPISNPKIAKPSTREMQPMERDQQSPSPRIISLSDLADIRYDPPKKERYRRLDGKDAVTVRVIKTSSANTITVVKQVKEAIEEIKADPRLKGLDIYIYRDRAEPVITSLIKLRNAGILGGCLVIFILFFFLRNAKSTSIVVVAIPISILCAFAIMFLLRRLFGSEITINIISLSGMMLAVGMLVDPAIVVLENIFRHKEQKGLDARTASVAGTSEVGLAIIAATATTISVFIPLVFLSKSRMGIFLHDFGVTICITTAASLFIALTLVPLAASRLLSRMSGYKIGVHGRRGVSPVMPHNPYLTATPSQPANTNPNLVSQIRARCTNFVKITIKHKWLTIGTTTLIVIISIFLFKGLDKEIARSLPYREARIWVDTPKNYNINDTKRLFNRLEDVINSKKDELEITTISSDFDKQGGVLEIYLLPKEKAALSVETVQERIKSLLPVIPGVKYSTARMYGYGPPRSSLNIELKGRNIETLKRIADQIKNELNTLPDIKDADTNLERGEGEIQVEVKREKASRHGITPQRIGFELRGALSSRAVSKLKAGDKEIDMILQIKEEERDTLEKLKDLTFTSASEAPVTINQVSSFEQRQGPLSIERHDRNPMVTLNINYLENIGLKRIEEDVSKTIKRIAMPPGYTWEIGESFRHYREEERELYFGILLATIIIYLIMASLFESFIHPFTIMLTIPFAFTGIAFVFFIMHIPLDDFAQIGMLLLCGLVVNNAIVLIDYINRLRNSGMGREEAVLKGVQDRFRPILMTSLTTILGLLPMVLPMIMPQFFGQLEGRERMWAPVGLVVISGMTTSTLLTLVILPTFYSIIDDIAQYCKKVIYLRYEA